MKITITGAAGFDSIVILRNGEEVEALIIDRGEASSLVVPRPKSNGFLEINV